ncbi:MAG: arginine deiminase-related protein [Pseudomonadota bacterium]
MVRPLEFSPNPETKVDNHFQTEANAAGASWALAEFDTMVDELRDAGITVHVFDEPRASVPDAVFPNNWFSTHDDGTIVTYPMYAPSRREEKRQDILDHLAHTYTVKRHIDLSPFVEQSKFLEGTGVIIFDHLQRMAYMARSKRANGTLLTTLCAELDYKPFVFDAIDREGRAIYHTNVMMSIGAHTALVGASCIQVDAHRARLLSNLQKSGRTVVTLSHRQIRSFAGNALEVKGKHGDVLIISERGFDSLSEAQRKALLERVRVLPVNLPTIETAGGSARCMMAGVHLPLPDGGQQAPTSP